MPARKIPDGHGSATPYLVLDGAAEAIEFYKSVFGAVEVMRHAREDGKIMHAELKLGPSSIMLADENPEKGARGPRSFGGSPVSFHLYVEDADATFGRAIGAGATVVRPLEDRDHGDRLGGLEDPFGHTWWIATRLEDPSAEEMQARPKSP
jgi:PhnB protein